MLGNELLAKHENWRTIVKKLQTVDWDRSNKQMWEGRCYNNGRMDHSNSAALLTVNALKHHLGLPLTTAQQKLEITFKGIRNGK